MIWLLLPLLLLPAAFAGAIVWLGRQIQRPPPQAPASHVGDGRPVLLCLGDSITHGRIGADWVSPLAEDLPGWQLVNAGVNSETAWAVRQRLEGALACKPTRATLLVGTNDVLASLSDDWGRSYVRAGGLPGPPSLQGYERELRGLVSDLCLASVEVALVTLPPLGDDPTSVEAASIDAHNGVVRTLAEERGLVLLDLYTALAENRGGGQALGTERGPVLKAISAAAFGHYARGRSWDEVRRLAGWSQTVDGIHLDDVSAHVLGELVRGWMEAA